MERSARECSAPPCPWTGDAEPRYTVPVDPSSRDYTPFLWILPAFHPTPRSGSDSTPRHVDRNGGSAPQSMRIPYACDHHSHQHTPDLYVDMRPRHPHSAQQQRTRSTPTRARLMRTSSHHALRYARARAVRDGWGATLRHARPTHTQHVLPDAPPPTRRDPAHMPHPHPPMAVRAYGGHSDAHDVRGC